MSKVFFLDDNSLEMYIAEVKREALKEVCGHLRGVDDSHKVTVREVVEAIERYRDSISQ